MTTQAMNLPTGYELWTDDDGDYWLLPPIDIILVSEPGESFLIGPCDRETALQDALDELGRLGLA